MAKFQFSAIEDEKLIEYVAARPILYDSGNPEYKNIGLRENIWKEIAEKVERTVADCKKRWRNMRDTYMKHRKIGTTGSEASSKKFKWNLLEQLNFLNKVSYERTTQSNVEGFVQGDDEPVDEVIHSSDTPSVEENNDSLINATIRNIREPPQNVSSESSSKKPTKKTATDGPHISKRAKDNSGKIVDILMKRSQQREMLVQNVLSQPKDEDAIGLFFKSLAMTVKTFPPELVIEAKSRIYSIINELEFRSHRMKTLDPQRPVSAESLLTSQPSTPFSEESIDLGNYYTSYSPYSDNDVTQL